MSFNVWRSIVCAATALCLCAFSAAAGAQAYPTKPIRFIVGFAPGGSADVMSRVIGQKLTETLGQAVITENKPGAAGTLGADLVARAAPDGYTLLVGSVSNVVISASTLPKLPFDPVKDFAPITLTASIPLVLVVNPGLPVKSVQELIAYAKANPGRLNFASGGNGVSNHLAGELFNRMAGVDMVHVPYKGDGPGVAAVLAGEAQLMFATVSTAMPHVQSGRLRALAVGTPHRLAALPDLPTIDEAGVAGYEVNVWNGILAPAGTPKEIVNKLHAEITKVLQLPDVKARLAGLGFEIVASTPEQLGAVIRADMAKWPKIAKESGAKVD
ncbi:MAG TPA: tripartite tricarboxylate transporter substrate binding protein [Casimicrobiaceae bacterium]|nr:tripartite tricarboxylate transporter substrate binding protein [Casimicrobiaceae bacterium]